MLARVRPLFSILLLAAVLALTAGCRFTFDTAGADRTINVQGEGEAKVTPDIATVSIGVQTRGPEAGAAVEENNQIANAIAAGLKELGVEEKDIQTSNFSIIPQQSFDDQGRPVGDVFYVVDNTVTVTLHDLSKVGPALDAAVNAGANNVYGVSFGVEDDEAALKEARDKAMADAKARAGQLASASGATLGNVINISEAIYGYPVFARSFDKAVAEAGGGAPVSPGTLEVAVQVNVTYELK